MQCEDTSPKPLYSADTAQNYMRVARFVDKNRSASVFLALEPTVLYRLAAVPDELAATLDLDTLLTDPRTGQQTPLQEMERPLVGPAPPKTAAAAPCARGAGQARVRPERQRR